MKTICRLQLFTLLVILLACSYCCNPPVTPPNLAPLTVEEQQYLGQWRIVRWEKYDAPPDNEFIDYCNFYDPMAYFEFQYDTINGRRLTYHVFGNNNTIPWSVENNYLTASIYFHDFSNGSSYYVETINDTDLVLQGNNYTKLYLNKYSLFRQQYPMEAFLNGSWDVTYYTSWNESTDTFNLLNPESTISQVTFSNVWNPMQNEDNYGGWTITDPDNKLTGLSQGYRLVQNGTLISVIDATGYPPDYDILVVDSHLIYMARGSRLNNTAGTPWYSIKRLER